MDRAPQMQTAATPARKRIVDLLARATRTELENALGDHAGVPEHVLFTRSRNGPCDGPGPHRRRRRAVQSGRGDHEPGQHSVTDGRIGHGYRLGTDRKAATLAAVIDALAQDTSTLENPRGRAFLRGHGAPRG